MSGSASFVMMMQAAHLSPFDHLSLLSQLRPPWLWGVFAERKMRPPMMVIGEV